MKKVTARHLMIGDWVRFKGHEVQVKQLWRNILDEIVIDYGAVVSTKFATPIPITEEWLKLNGWSDEERFDNTSFVNDSSKSIEMNYIFDDEYLTLAENTYFGIQYIHQLQQAYRLACNKELKVKF